MCLKNQFIIRYCSGYLGTFPYQTRRWCDDNMLRVRGVTAPK
jgi:hypothetical protein